MSLDQFKQTRPLIAAAAGAASATRRCCDLMEQFHWTSRVFCLSREAAARVLLARRRRRQCATGLLGRRIGSDRGQHV